MNQRFAVKLEYAQYTSTLRQWTVKSSSLDDVEFFCYTDQGAKTMKIAIMTQRISVDVHGVTCI